MVDFDEPFGPRVPLTLKTRAKWCELALRERLQQWDEIMLHVEKGVKRVLDQQYLKIMSPVELDLLICGTPEVNWNLLRAHSTAKGFDGTPEKACVLEWLWDELKQLTNSEAEKFVRFVCSRSRLPHEEILKAQGMRVSLVERDDPDKWLPTSQTCFFHLMLPQYSSREILAAKLRYAISSCIAIDADEYARYGSFT